MRAAGYDVVVVGGGSAGVAAALAAARAGAHTALVERAPLLGGNAAQALVHTLCGLYAEGPEPRFANGGIPRELARALGGDPERAGRAWYLPMRPAAYAALLAERCGAELNLELWLAAELEAAALGRGDTSRAQLVVRAGDAPRELESALAIDASGDAALAALVGADCEMAAPEVLQCPSYVFRIAGVAPRALEGFARVQITGALAQATRGGALPLSAESVVLRDCGPDHVYATLNVARPARWAPLDPSGLAEIEAAAHAAAEAVARFLRETRAGFGASQLAEHPRRLGVRETRRGLGLAVMTEDDVLEGRTRDDEVARSCWPIELWRDHRRASLTWPAGPSSIPLGALVSRTHPRLGLAGRCLSSTHEANGALRVIGTALATGEAIGRAAALAADAGCALAAIAPASARPLDPEA
jgi:glycine/D-amino acid oxidase-like deaminating enzyme